MLRGGAEGPSRRIKPGGGEGKLLGGLVKNGGVILGLPWSGMRRDAATPGRGQRRVNLSPEGVAGERLVDHQNRRSEKHDYVRRIAAGLESVSPVQKHVDPVAADLIAATAGSDFIRTADTEIVCRLISVVRQIRRIIPENVHAHAHPRRDEIPQIPFAQHDAVAVELIEQARSSRSHHSRARDSAPAVAIHSHIDTLKVSAEQHRARGSRGTRQPAFRAPQKQVMAEQKTMREFFAARATAIFALLEGAHGAEGVGSDVPDDARPVRAVQAVANSIRSRVEQCLTTAIAVVLNAVAAAAVVLRTVVDVAEP